MISFLFTKKETEENSTAPKHDWRWFATNTTNITWQGVSEHKDKQVVWFLEQTHHQGISECVSECVCVCV